MPVKTNNDLLLLMSDLYEVTKNGQIVRKNPRQELPNVTLDPAHYAMIGSFKKLVNHAPSLLEARNLHVTGAWHFDRPISIRGEVTLIGLPGQVNRIPANMDTLQDMIYSAQG